MICSLNKNPFKQLWLISFLLFSLLLGACSTGNTIEPENTVSPTNNNNEQVNSDQENAFSGVLRIAMQPIVHTDPINISTDAEILVAHHIYDYLIDIDAQSNIIPRLATNWAISDDGTEYIFTLAEGVKWHDGSNFSANDVVWTFNRLRNTPEVPTADLYSNIENIEATGDLEVTFTLQRPNPFFLYDLSDNHALVMKANTENADSHFNGTGPFKVVDYVPEDRIELVANPDYFIEGQPHLAGFNIIFFPDDGAAAEGMRSGEIDLMLRLPTALFDSLATQEELIATHIPTNGFDLIRLRSDREPGNDPRVIRALKLATDREQLLEIVQLGYGAIANDHPIGPLYGPYHNSELTALAYDVETARTLLAEAGYDEDNPLSLVLHTPDTGGRPDLAAVLKSQWEKAGVEIEISVEPESVYYGVEGWLEVDLGITSWGSRPYPQFYLDVMLVSDAKWNESHFSNKEFDELASIAGTSLDEQQRIEAYSDIQQLLIDEGPIIIPYYFAQFGVIRNTFEGFELKAFAGRTDFRTLTYIEE